MNLRETAKCLLHDFDIHKPGSIFERKELSISINNAYDLQFEVAAMRESRGERIAGYKIGCISDTMQRQLGIEQPVFGHLWDTEIYPSGAQLDTEDFDGLAIEGELAVRLLDDVPSARWLRNNPQVVSSYFLVIELHNYVFRGTEINRAVELVTNNAIHAGVVIANEETPLTRFNRGAIIRVIRNAERIGEGVPAHLQHGAIDVVATVSEHLELRGLNLKRGQLVLTGSPLPLWRVTAGDRIMVQCDGLSDVCCEVTKRN